MRAYRVEGGGQTRFAGTSALARETRVKIVDETSVKKSEVTIEEVEIPTPKPEFLEFLNKLLAEFDATE